MALSPVAAMIAAVPIARAPLFFFFFFCKPPPPPPAATNISTDTATVSNRQISTGTNIAGISNQSRGGGGGGRLAANWGFKREY